MQQLHYEPHFKEDTSGRYRSVYVPAVISLVFGCLSILGFLGGFWCMLPVIGIVIGWLALVRIHELPQELTGEKYAKAGIIVSVAFTVLFGGYHLFRSVREVPWGYVEVTYEELQPLPNQLVSDRAQELVGQRVFVRGYMDTSRRNVDLRKFVVCPKVGHCNFCTPNPEPTEMIRVELTGNLRTDYTTNLMRIGGMFKVDETHPSGVPYYIEADYMR